MTIVKVQRALFPSDQTDCLVYDKGQKHVSQQPVDDAVMNAMKSRPGMTAYRAFFQALWDTEFSGWIIGSIVPDEDW